MAGMYPDNQELTINGEQIMWPGVDSTGKFTNGDFNDPLIPPSFIPAESINLILDNLSETIKRFGGTPNNTSMTQLADAIDKRFINLYKNGYIQWPGMPSPLEDVSLHFEGYSWYEVNYDGNFFRAKGRNAKPFSSKKLTKEQIKNGSYVSQDDEQGDAIRDFSVNRDGLLGLFFWGDRVSQRASWNGYFPWGDAPDKIYGIDTKFSASRKVPTAEENRPRNLTFTIWALVKDE